MRDMKRFLIFGVLCLFLAGCGTIGVRTAPLDDLAWEAGGWISVPTPAACDGTGWFVCPVTNQTDVLSVKWMTTALSAYQLYVNGRRVGTEVFKAAQMSDAARCRSLTYDLTSDVTTLADCVNTFAAEVSKGSRSAFRSVIEITYYDGRQDLIGTDCESWRCGIDGPVRLMADGGEEFQDGRVADPYKGSSVFTSPADYEGFTGEIVPAEGPELTLCEDQATDPVDRRQVIPGEPLIIDLGGDGAKVPRLTVDAVEGTEIRITPGERLADTPSCGFTYLCRKGRQVVQPRFRYFDCRSCVLTASAPTRLSCRLIPVLER